MTATVIDPAAVARDYRERVKAEVAKLDKTPRVAGLLAEHEGPAAVYAEYARRGAEAVGIGFELIDVADQDPAAAIAAANADPTIDGIFCYYPIRGNAQDWWLRELVDPRKDIEGMHSFWSRCLYENRRYLDVGRTQRTILPCTPLAILKLLHAAGMRTGGERAPLEGVTACVINRSDIVGRPLSAMLANDGADVISLDLDSVVHFEPAIGRHAHAVADSPIGRRDALAQADLVITGVPSRDFDLVRGDEIKPGAICVNFSEFRNFDDSVLDVASTFVPRVGPMTVTMATRNLVRLMRMAQG